MKKKLKNLTREKLWMGQRKCMNHATPKKQIHVSGNYHISDKEQDRNQEIGYS